MRLGPYEFSLRELGGSMGDFGTLLPLAVGYVAVCGMDPAGLLVMMGLANIATGLVFRLPMPIEPMKVLAVVAIADAWTPERVYASGLVMGAAWLLMGLTGAMGPVARLTPKTVTRGIQLSLGIMLAVRGFGMLASWWALGAVSVAIVLVLRRNRYAPAAVVLVALGTVIMAVRGQLAGVMCLSVSLPGPSMVDWREIWPSLRDGGLAQIPLTAANAVIATSALISEYWPDRRVTGRQLSLSMGVMNLALPVFGGMPLCHGAGGLAGQYYFGARTGGANVIEGLVEAALGLFLAGSVAALFAAFPEAIVGAMLLLVGVELVKFARDLRPDRGLLTVLATVACSVAVNMALGFAGGLVVHWVVPRGPGGPASPTGSGSDADASRDGDAAEGRRQAPG